MSLLNTSLIRDAEPGFYYTNIHSYKECKPANRQPYILVEMLVDGLYITDRWYSSRIPYIMRCLRKQFRKDYFDCTLSELLEYARTHKILIGVSYDARYGQQIDYDNL